MIGDMVYKLMMCVTPDDVRLAVRSDCSNEMQKLVEALGWLAFRWWSRGGEVDPKKLKEIQSRLAELQLIIYKAG